MTPLAWRNMAAVILGLIGLLQISGHLIGSNTLKGLGAATTASPFPKVFSDVDGLETFASEFVLEIETTSGRHIQQSITPQLYQQLAGPYNRRNVYGAALSYAPRLPQPLWEAIFCYGLRPGGPLRVELGLPEDAARVSLVIRTKTRGRSDTWILKPSCTE